MPNIYLPYIRGGSLQWKPSTIAYSELKLHVRQVEDRWVVYARNDYTETEYTLLIAERETQAEGERLRLSTFSQDALWEYISYNRIEGEWDN